MTLKHDIMALSNYNRVSFYSNLFPLRFRLVSDLEGQLKWLPIRVCNCCSSTLCVCDRIYYTIARSYTVIFFLKTLFHSVQKPDSTCDRRRISGTEQGDTAHLFEISLHSSQMIYRILSWGIYHKLNHVICHCIPQGLLPSLCISLSASYHFLQASDFHLNPAKTLSKIDRKEPICDAFSDYT